MLNFIEKIFVRLRAAYGPKQFAAIAAVLVVLSVVGLGVGWKFTRHIKRDPDFCNSCHMMREVYTQWGNSAHKTVVCQDCHKVTVFEQNVLMVKHVLYGSKNAFSKHGKALPWQECASCHYEQSSQGASPAGKTAAAFGHYRHRFVECWNCHPFASHDFPADSSSCGRCHKGKEVHGRMEGLACPDCHIFTMREGATKDRVVPTRLRCMKCHAGSFRDAASAPMSKLECFDCHRPHGLIEPDDGKCRGCHIKDITDKGHVIHKTACKDCHRAHTWRITEPRKLCGKCHEYREVKGVF